MSIDARLTRLMPTLTAKERAILILRAWKARTDEDPLWRRTMPADQSKEFNRLIGLMNVANIQLGHLVTFLEKEVEKLELTDAWLFTLLLWQEHVTAIEFSASVVAREAISQSRYQLLQAELAKEYVPLGELADELVAERRAWGDDDLEDVGWTTEFIVKPDSWQRLSDAAADEIREAAGEMETKGKGASLRIKRSSYSRWLGQPVKPRPEWAAEYQVLPDEEWFPVAVNNRSLQHLRQALQTIPLDRIVEAPAERGLGRLIDALATKQQRSLEMRWSELCALEVVLAEMSEHFNGEDVLRPVFRERIDWAKDTIKRLIRLCSVCDREPQLGKPHQEDLHAWRGFVERNA